MNIRLSRTAATIIGALAMLITVAGPAAAVVPAEGDRLSLIAVEPSIDVNKQLVVGTFFKFSQYGANPQAGTQVTASIYSCGQLVKQQTVTMDGSWNAAWAMFSPSGMPDPNHNTVNAKIGPSFEYYLDITQPAPDGTYYEPYRISGATSNYGVQRPSCDEILNGTPELPTPPSDKLVVQKWSTKVSLARIGTKPFVGKKVKITRTVSNGQESYQWKVGNKIVKNKGLKLGIKRAYKGKKVSVRIVATKGSTTKAKTLNFGRAR